MNMKQTLLNMLVCAAALAGDATLAPAQSGGSFTMSGATIDGGGGPSSGGTFWLNGTIGQPDAGAPISGGGFTIKGGFWIPDIPSLPPYLAIRLAGANTIILSWPNPSTGYVLQQTSNMSAPNGGWMDVTQAPVINGSNKEITLTASGAFCLFRLRQP